MLTGKLTRLRALEPSDAETLARWFDDPVVSRVMVGYPVSLAQVVKRCRERPRNTYGSLVLCIESLASGRALGVIALTGAEPESGWAELSIYLGDAEFRGGGYGTDAVRVLCRYGFDQMRLHGVHLLVAASNAGARHVYSKVGFVEEGRQRQRFHQDGEWHDSIMMSLLAGELGS
ncbi:Protein N-acetyltransferase, RimJ/RimL family [Amycolatopsis xylanica]|uniref:Protein N-acetyltransferase, RimJ/RimL family n=1 Tax=Amycolatopsis xylanica TaxID=589385 RepID=A0A1H3Q560_9PSEU|nr:GNAT family protein [Amycolatopsis xylanica]SDZ08654.1 Protein N-acetyltransferase, RimJ/RimL family [Amycolatopsis xylanica]